MRPRTRAQLTVRRALHSAARRWTTRQMRERMGLPPNGLITVYDGVTVIRASHHPGYGVSTHKRGQLTHVVGAVYTAWQRGAMVGALAKWRCGASTVLFRLDDDAAGQLCPLCLAAVARGNGAELVVVMTGAGGVRR